MIRFDISIPIHSSRKRSVNYQYKYSKLTSYATIQIIVILFIHCVRNNLIMNSSI